jgi:hypothetical protein
VTVNAVRYFVRHLSPDAIVRLARHRSGRFDATAPVDDVAARDDLIDAVGDRFAGDLVELLNACRGDDLDRLARAVGIDAPAVRGPRQPAMRDALWRWGAALEAGGPALAGTPLQPRPVLLGGHLVIQAPPRGPFAASATWPRPLPPARAPVSLDGEPETLDDLLAAADRAIGVRLGPRGRDKGAWGARAAALLGVVEHNRDEPDWRGDVEIKTVPVARDGARWRIAEDPAVSMRDAAPIAKLQRVLWLARAPVPDDDATIIGWYLLGWDDVVARLVRRYLHVRPKGPGGTSATGWYLHRRFFADAGLLATLNG